MSYEICITIDYSPLWDELSSIVEGGITTLPFGKTEPIFLAKKFHDYCDRVTHENLPQNTFHVIVVIFLRDFQLLNYIILILPVLPHSKHYKGKE